MCEICWLYGLYDDEGRGEMSEQAEKVVELKSAFHWHCDQCGESNFALPQKAEMTDDDAEYAYRRFHDLDDWCELPADWRQFEMVSIPSKVTCSRCEGVFLTMDETLG